MRRSVEVLLWWVLLTALELLLVSVADPAEIVVAVVLGLAVALVAAAARAAQPTSWSVRARWLRWLLPLPLAVLRDTATVFRSALTGSSGEWRRVPVAEAAGDSAHSRGARGVGALLLSAAPGTVVVDVDPETGRALLHAFAGTGGSALERALSR